MHSPHAAVSSHTAPTSRTAIGRARLTQFELDEAIPVIAVDGDVDAHNSRDFADFIARATADRASFVLDLRTMEFFGTEALSAMHLINVACCRQQGFWTFVPGAEVGRMLRICDTRGGLPVSATLESAVDAAMNWQRRTIRTTAVAG